MAQDHGLQRGRRRLLRGGAALAWSSVCTLALGASYEMRVITHGDDEATRKILKGFAARYPDHHSSSDIRRLSSRKSTAVYVALGPAALRAALDTNPANPVLALFTSSATYLSMVTASEQLQRRQNLTTAIHAEVSPVHQMELIRSLYRRSVTVGVLLTARTAHLEPLLQAAAQACHLELKAQVLGFAEHPVQALSRLRSALVILAVPDSDLYNAANFRAILEATYRRNQAVIGYSPGLVHAGALAACYSTVDDTLAQVGQATDTLASGMALEPQYPRYWRTSLNDSVARSLNIVVDERTRSLGTLPT